MSWGFTGRRRWRHASDLQVTGWQVCGRNDIFLDQWIPWAKVLQGRQGLWLFVLLTRGRWNSSCFSEAEDGVQPDAASCGVDRTGSQVLAKFMKECAPRCF